MIESKYINVIVIVLIIAAVLASVGLVYLSDSVKATAENTQNNLPEYAEKIFGEDIISIEISADEAEWQKMLDNAMAEEYIMANIVVNGTEFKNVGIRPKGNSSLMQVNQTDSDRFSFRLKFDKYIKGQTCFGLSSFVINNMMGDNTYMKEYVSYDLMKFIGVDCVHYGYADVKLNGSAWGFYLAAELYNESYERRVFNTDTGVFYNIKSMDMAGGANMPDMGINPSRTNLGGERPPMPPEGANMHPDEMRTNMEGGMRPFGNKELNGADLKYNGSDTASYTNIFGNATTKNTNNSDYKKIIKALEKLSNAEELEKYFDVDKILRYLAAHTVVVNLDSYSSDMCQNYVIYENNGKLTILPWDYGLAFGGMDSNSASDVINFPINTPVSGVEMEDRPLIDILFKNEQYLNRYHEYIKQITDGYLKNGKFAQNIEKIDTMISGYVANDASSFINFNQYETAVKTFITLGELRAKSIEGQLNETIPSTTAGQSENKTALIDAGELKLSDLGGMGAGNRGNRNN